MVDLSSFGNFLKIGVNFQSLFQVIFLIVLPILVSIIILIVLTWWILKRRKYNIQVLILEKVGETVNHIFDKGAMLFEAEGFVYFKLLKRKNALVQVPSYTSLISGLKGGTKLLILSKFGEDSYSEIQVKTKDIFYRDIVKKEKLFANYKGVDPTKEIMEGIYDRKGNLIQEGIIHFIPAETDVKNLEILQIKQLMEKYKGKENWLVKYQGLIMLILVLIACIIIFAIFMNRLGGLINGINSGLKMMTETCMPKQAPPIS